MTCCEGWTSCNGICLLILLLLGVVLNAIPLGIDLVEQDENFPNLISCYEWWFPGIIGAGLMAFPATTMSLSARKRACCNNRVGMFLSSLFNVLTIIGAVYCMLVSLLALLEGPLICSSPVNSTAMCEFSLKNLSDFSTESLNLQWWFLNGSCVPPTGSQDPTTKTMGRILSFNFDEERQKIFHLSIFLGLLVVGILELLFGLSQIIIGFLGCLCGVSKRRRQTV